MGRDGRPLLTVIIPSRERCETLRFSIATVAEQKFPDVEILVSDNVSQDDTPGVVRAFEDPRINYIRAPRRLSMCDHWDFAFEHARGEYVIIIGDDDGLMPGALEKIAALIAGKPAQAYSWQPHQYVWPIAGAPPKLSLTPRVEDKVLDLRQNVIKVLRRGGWAWGRELVPMYHTAVKKELADQIKARTGRVFHSMNPDVFTAYALVPFLRQAVKLGEPMSVLGASAKSNSGAPHGGDRTFVSMFLHEVGDYRVHEQLCPAAPFIANAYADSALVAMKLFPEYFSGMKFRHEAMWAWAHRATKSISLASVIKKRREIRACYPFSIPQFVFCRWGIHGYEQFNNVTNRWFARRDLRARMQAAGINTLPHNILEAAGMLSKLCAVSV